MLPGYKSLQPKKKHQSIPVLGKSIELLMTGLQMILVVILSKGSLATLSFQVTGKGCIISSPTYVCACVPLYEGYQLNQPGRLDSLTYDAVCVPLCEGNQLN